METLLDMGVAEKVAQLQASAAAHEKEAFDSFERCDTDGFMSQWASGLSAQHDRLEAQLVLNGGVAKFPALFDLQGNWVPARLIYAKYGPCWMVLDNEGKFDGHFVSAYPKQRKTIANKGFLEGTVLRPAKVGYSGEHVSNVVCCYKPLTPPFMPPVGIVSSDRFSEEG